jgi:putative endonuclease
MDPEKDPGTISGTNWTVYIIRCDDGSLYTGVSTDVERRFREHLERPRGAKYFNGRKPLGVAWREDGHSRSSACRREAAIKKLSRDEKLRLVGDPPARQ